MNKTCGDCSKCKNRKVIATCGCIGIVTDDIPACNKFEQRKKTLFDKITASPEVLAEELIHVDFEDIEFPYIATLTGKCYKTWEQAVNKTIKKLKEVCDE